ncbi:hypothetical protein ACIGW0_01905 [Streptomyces bikiniensis]|uniref:Uncharacterized protein n=1 Tax=Streptomyces bikiniensis TaxID=1896 RepID=A0ABW8CKS7_STRBI
MRRVPVPPHLVAVLREHLIISGTADGGRLFFGEKGSEDPSSTYYRVRQEARLLALPPAVAASPPASRPYYLRHPARHPGSMPVPVRPRWPSEPATARRFLPSRYAKSPDGRQDVANRRVGNLLPEYE